MFNGELDEEIIVVEVAGCCPGLTLSMDGGGTPPPLPKDALGTLDTDKPPPDGP